MRYIILIFILFFNFSYVNADAIYNLIKIPNLEVHKVDDVNGIKYLVSKRGFVIGDTNNIKCNGINNSCLLYTSPSPRDRQKSRMPSSA